MDRYVMKDGKRLRYGYTTGSCATGAAKAAAMMLLGGSCKETVIIKTPKGWELPLSIHDIRKNADSVSCAVQKDCGDDPDVTNEIMIYAKVQKCESGMNISGGEGIGVVTLIGLEIPVGEAAINKTPRAMIAQAVNEVAEEYGYKGGFNIEISAPMGEEVAKRTFNSRLGIIGGISILGTTGIVEPMSEEAMIESLRIEMNVLRNKGTERVLFCPGNYGCAFAKEYLRLNTENVIKISNYIGDMIDHALGIGFKQLLLVAHFGKAVKIAGGIMNTHSRFADCRGEILSAHAILCGADALTAKQILGCITTDAMVDVLKDKGICESVMESVMQRIEENLSRRAHNKLEIGAVVFSNSHGLLGIGESAKVMIGEYKYE